MHLDSRFYLNWLSISVPEGVTPDHYTLLGIRYGETDIAIIDQAADVRFCMMRKVDIGEYPDEFREMLRQLETARAELIFPLRSGVKPAAVLPVAPPMNEGRVVVGKEIVGKEIVRPKVKPVPQNAGENDGSLVGWKSKAVFFAQCAVAFGLGMCVCVSMMAAAPRHPDKSVNFDKKDTTKTVEIAPYTTLPDADGKRPDVVQIDDKIRELATDIPAVEPDELDEPMDLSPLSPLPEEPIQTLPEEPTLVLPETMPEPQVESPVKKAEDITPIRDETPDAAEPAPVSATPELRSPGTRRISPLRKIRSENTVAQTTAVQPEVPETDAVPETEIPPQAQLAAESLLSDSLNMDIGFILPEVPEHLTDTPAVPEAAPVAPAPKVVRLPVPSAEELAPEKVKLDVDLEKLKGELDRRREYLAEFYEGAVTKDITPAKRFLAMDTALTLAVVECDLPEAMKILNTMVEYFEIDGAVARSEMLQGYARQLIRKQKADETRDLVGDFLDAGIDGCELLVSARHFERAARLSDTVSNVCARIGTEDEKKTADEKKGSMNALWGRWMEYTRALETLQTSPEDRLANHIVGRWVCEMEQKLAASLPYFARGMDETLRGLARQELGMAADGEVNFVAAMKLGDGWWQLAEAKGYSPPMLKVMRDHAISIYKKIEPLVDDPSTRHHLSSRISQTEAMER